MSWVELSWDDTRWDFSKAEYRDDIYNLMMYLIRLQDGHTALHGAARCGNIDITKLLIDGGADVTARKSSVSDMIWKIVMTACVSDCFIKLCDDRVIVMITSKRHHRHLCECNYSNLQVCTIAHFLHIWEHGMRWYFFIRFNWQYLSFNNVFDTKSGWYHRT